MNTSRITAASVAALALLSLTACGASKDAKASSDGHGDPTASAKAFLAALQSGEDSGKVSVTAKKDKTVTTIKGIDCVYSTPVAGSGDGMSDSLSDLKCGSKTFSNAEIQAMLKAAGEKASAGE